MYIKNSFTLDYIQRKGEKPGTLRILKWMILREGAWIVILYRFARKYKKSKIFPGLGILRNWLLISRISTKYDVEFRNIHDIGFGLHIPHPHNVVVGVGVKIGDNVTLYNGVTLGAKIRIEHDTNKNHDTRYPIVEEGVTIYSGAKVLGPVTIGKNSIIGANAVVLDSFPPNSILIGVPARNIADRSNGKISG